MVLNVSDSSEPIRLDTTNAVLSPKERTYFFTGFTDKTINSCELHKILAKKKVKEVHKCETKEQRNEIPAEETETCADVYPDQAKQNLFLLLMNGVRVVFTKTLAFNTLLTIRAVLF